MSILSTEITENVLHITGETVKLNVELYQLYITVQFLTFLLAMDRLTLAYLCVTWAQPLHTYANMNKYTYTDPSHPTQYLTQGLLIYLCHEIFIPLHFPDNTVTIQH